MPYSVCYTKAIRSAPRVLFLGQSGNCGRPPCNSTRPPSRSTRLWLLDRDLQHGSGDTTERLTTPKLAEPSDSAWASSVLHHRQENRRWRKTRATIADRRLPDESSSSAWMPATTCRPHVSATQQHRLILLVVPFHPCVTNTARRSARNGGIYLRGPRHATYLGAEFFGQPCLYGLL